MVAILFLYLGVFIPCLLGASVPGAEYSSAFAVVPRRLAYWRFDSPDWRNEAGSFPLELQNVAAGEGVHGSALRVPSSPGPAGLRFRVVENDGLESLNLEQGAIRFLYRPLWVYQSPRHALVSSTPWGARRPPSELCLLEIGRRSGDGWSPQLALAINESGEELILKTYDEHGLPRTNFAAAVTWSLTRTRAQSAELVGDWCEIVVNYTRTNSALVVNGALKQDKRTGAWGGAGIPRFSVDRTGVVFAIGSTLDGKVTAQGLIDELEVFDRPIGPLRNYSFAARYAASATVTGTPPSVVLHWVSADRQPVVIRRRGMGESDWTVLSTNAVGMSFVDDSPTIRAGTVYEYEIGQRTLLVAVEAPPVETRGRVIVLVDQTLAPKLKESLDSWVEDLVGDGWEVVRYEVPRHDDNAWNQNAINKQYINDVRQIKSIISREYAAAPDRTRAVVLVGHVTVPLSGLGAEDGHPEMKGAWPADSFYGDIDGDWSDKTANQASQNKQLQNVPEDGKFDVHSFDELTAPSGRSGAVGVELAVGRIDFARLPAFRESEADLLKRYFAKNHVYRHGVASYAHGVVGGGFFFSLYHQHSQIIDANAVWTGSRLFGVGSDKVVTGDAFSIAGGCLFGMQGGYGAYDAINNSVDANRALGVGRYSAADLARSAIEPSAWFYVLKGSYFANWNVGDNNFIKAVLAAKERGLGAVFTMDTLWRFESAAIGEPLATGLIQTSRGRQSVRTSFFLGDPTLRLVVTPPPSNLSARRARRQVSLRWDASSLTGALYHVYRSTNGVYGEFVRLTPAPITSTEFTDVQAPSGRTVYMVRALARVTTGSGSFTNLSQGVFTSVR